MQEAIGFIRRNRFALGAAAAWLATMWALVLAAQAYFGSPLSLTAWAGNWDGGWYQSIVQSGYYAGVPSRQENVAFFPLFPALVWLVSKLFLLPAVWAGMVVSSLSFAGALVVLHRFVAKRFSVRTARWTIFLLAFNPFSFYFGMMYTEALFLLLVAGTLWYVYQKEWWLAALFAGLGSGARSVGIALGVYVVGSWFYSARSWRSERPGEARQNGVAAKGVPGNNFVAVPTKFFWGILADRTPSFRRFTQRLFSRPPGGRGPAVRSAPKNFLSGLRQKDFWGRPAGRHPTFLASPVLSALVLILLSFSGLILFSLYLWQHTGDPLVFRHAQEFWPGRGGLSNIIAEISYLITAKTINLEYAVTCMWYMATVVAFGGIVLLVKMRQHLMALFSAIALSLPLIFGTATSMNRYALVAAPIFIAYASLITGWPRWAKICIAGLCVVGMAVAIYVLIDPRAIFVG